MTHQSKKLEKSNEFPTETDLPKIVINNTPSEPYTEKTDRKNRSSGNRRKYAWLINLLLLICIAYVAYCKRDMLREQFFANEKSDKPASTENQTFNSEPTLLDISLSPPPVETPPIQPEVTSVSSQELISYEDLREPYRQEQPFEQEADESVLKMQLFTEDLISEDIDEVGLAMLIDRVKSDASVVYESGFTATSWDIRESMIAELAESQLSLWQEGAEHEIPEACYLMAWCHREGYENIKKRNNTAFELFLMAAEKGFPPAQFDVGFHCYQNGIGTSKNKTKADQWFRRAAENDETRALFFQAVELQDQGQIEGAEQIFQKLAQKGFKPAGKRLENMKMK